MNYEAISETHEEKLHRLRSAKVSDEELSELERLADESRRKSPAHWTAEEIEWATAAGARLAASINWE